jgi:hypothetical protein
MKFLNKPQIIFPLLFAIVLLWHFGHDFFEKSILKKTGFTIVKAEILGISPRIRRTLSGFQYQFVFKQKTYQDSRTSFKPTIAYQKGDSMYVAVSNDYPTLNFLLYYPAEFEEFEQPYPTKVLVPFER